MKGLINKEGKLLRLENGKAKVSDDPTIFPDDMDIKAIGIKDVKLVTLDVTIEKPKAVYTVAKRIR